MKLEKYVNMNSAQLDAEIEKEKKRIKKAKATIALLEKLKLVPGKTAHTEGDENHDE